MSNHGVRCFCLHTVALCFKRFIECAPEARDHLSLNTDEEVEMGMPTIINRVFFVSLLMLIASWSIAVVHAAESPMKETTHRAPPADINTMSANSVDDTLKACLARIPEVATTGQRLLAEQNCRGEERARQETQATPRF